MSDRISSETDAPPASATRNGAVRRVVAEYPYTENGVERYVVVRFEPKDFRQKHKSRDGSYAWNMHGVERIVYRHDELRAGIAAGKAILFLEGEKDVDRVLASPVLSARYAPTTIAQGAKATKGAQLRNLPRRFVQMLSGAPEIAIVADNDDVGRLFAETVAETVSGTIPTIRLLPALPSVGEHCDLSDYLETHTDEDALRVLTEAPIWTAQESLLATFVQKMNTKLAQLSDPVGHILYELRNRVQIVKPAQLKIEFADVLPPEGRDAIDVWLKHPRHRRCGSIVFAPGVETPNDYNLWRGWAVEPKEGDTAIFWRHVREVIAAGDYDRYIYLRKYLAHLVQKPAELPRTAIILYGDQGAGKGAFMDVVRGLVAPHSAHVASTEKLTGRFNAHTANKLVIFANEATWGGDKQREGILKALITEPRTQMEEKNQPIIEVDNYTRLFIVSNEKWCVAVGHRDRRFVFYPVANTHVNESMHFDPYFVWLSDGGVAAVMYDLLQEDIADWDPRRRPTSGLAIDLQLRSASTFEQWLYGCLHETEIRYRTDQGHDQTTHWDVEHAKDAVLRSYYAHCQTQRVRPEDQALFWRQLNEVGLVERDVRRRSGGRQRRMVQLLPLHAARQKYQDWKKLPESIWRNAEPESTHAEVVGDPYEAERRRRRNEDQRERRERRRAERELAGPETAAEPQDEIEF